MTPETPNAPSRKEYYEFVREQIQHEDGLVNQRQTWLLTSQAFWVTTFAVVYSQVPYSVGRDILLGIVCAASAVIMIGLYRNLLLTAGDPAKDKKQNVSAEPKQEGDQRAQKDSTSN